MSKDPNTKVGCVIVSPDKRRFTVGYNGFPSSIPDYKKWWNNKNCDDELCKYDLVNHAEVNAIMQAKTDLTGWSLYCTHFNCLDCARLICTTGISNVYYKESQDNVSMDLNMQKVRMLYKEAGIKVNQIVIV